MAELVDGSVERQRGRATSRLLESLIGHQSPSFLGEPTVLPGPRVLGPPVRWLLGVWVTAPDDEPVEWYDELDALRWSIRCVRKLRDGSLKAYSYDSSDWRDKMPEVPIPPLEEINENPDF